MTGKLFLCATPIGNLKDITLRALDVLKAVDLIAAEDTRHTRKLLTHFGIKKPLISFHEKNEQKMLPKLLDNLQKGTVIAQVSDAGMPGISDPGHRLVRACIEGNIPIEVLPGASALLTAAVLSGLPTDDIRFPGYLPRKSAARRRTLADLAEERSSLVFYESPHRLVETLADIADIYGDRQVFIGRELTKMFEEHLRGTATQLTAQLSSRGEVKGEVVLVIAGLRRQAGAIDKNEIKKAIANRIAAGQSKSEAVKSTAAELGLPRRTIYEIAHE